MLIPMLKRDLNIQVGPSLEEAKEYIYAIDFSRIINKLVIHQNWLREDAEDTCRLYRNYLFLKKKYEGQYKIPPSDDIDEFWHNHILDTEAYIRDCQFIFGDFLHHYPYFGIDDKTDSTDLDKAFEITQQLHFQEFGEYIEPTRSRYPKIIYYLMRKFNL